MNDSDRNKGISTSDAQIIDIVVRLVFVGLFAYWSLLLISPFVVPLIWSIVLAVALYPVFTRIAALLGGRRVIAAVIMTLAGLAIVIGPTALLTASMFESVQLISDKVNAGTIKIPNPPEFVRDLPIFGKAAFKYWSQAASNLADALAKITPFLKSIGGQLLQAMANVGISVLQFVASVIIAGILFVPGPKLVSGAKQFAQRIVATRGEEFVDLTGATIRNVSRGVIGISMLQALLAGIGLMAADVPAAGLIAFGVLILGIIQIGPGILLLPVIIWAWTAMDTLPALIFTVYMVPVTIVDNFLKPIVMARGLSTPMLVIFIGVLGGTLTHGLIGLFLGPVVLAVAWELVVAWVKSGRPKTDMPAAGDDE